VHKRLPYLLAMFVLAVSTLAASTLRAAEPARKPNIVFFLADDLGLMDIGAYNPGTFYETPHVDRLARDGMKFTAGYAANPVCSPTRYSILTGKFPTRVRATNWFSGKREGRFRGAPLNDVMPLAEVTLAEALKPQGYRTAYVGKWHLGPTEQYWPEAQGFDVNIGGHQRGSPPSYFSPYKNPRLKDGPPGEHLTARLADEAARIIEASKDEPFLLYVAFQAVHTPLQPPPELIAKYPQKAQRLGLTDKPEFADEEQVWPDAGPRKVRTLQKHATYAAMVESMDAAIGTVLAKLDALGLSDDTIVCFTSDNGGLSTSEGSPTSNLPLRGGKGWVYEGGIREPLVVKWPGVTKPGSECDVPVMSIDFYPTLLEAAGATRQANQIVDGQSLVPLLKGAQTLDRDTLYWHYPHYSNQGGFPGGAIRSGRYKLVERYEDGRVHLYDLAADPGERHDLAASQPERVADMKTKLHDWYRTVDAQFLQAKDDGPQPWRP
jgi:arylsulfatase A-like enzyme